MTPAKLQDLLARGLVERVEADPETARATLSDCKRHLASAERIATDDPNGAYQLLYDVARKAIAAHMLSAGLRASRNRPGAHATSRHTLGPRSASPRRRRRSDASTECGRFGTGPSTGTAPSISSKLRTISSAPV
jgi:hypothetical protein